MDYVGCKGHIFHHVDERKGGGWFPEKEKISGRDFPGGTVNKNPPASRGNTGLIAGSGRFHVLQRS